MEQERITVEEINTEDNLADMFTKGLAFPKFSKFRTALGIVDTKS